MTTLNYTLNNKYTIKIGYLAMGKTFYAELHEHTDENTSKCISTEGSESLERLFGAIVLNFDWFDKTPEKLYNFTHDFYQGCLRFYFYK